MKNPSSHTGIIIIVVVVVLAAMGYFYIQGGAAPATGLTAQTNGDVGLAEVNLLNQIQSIQINTALFQDASFLSLRDYTVEIPTQPVGRPNPFAPIPGVSNPNDLTKTK